MLLENKAVIELKQILYLLKTIDDNNYYDLQEVIKAENTIETLKQELDIIRGELKYLRHAL